MLTVHCKPVQVLSMCLVTRVVCAEAKEPGFTVCVTMAGWGDI
jgi:hypothetical protein